LHNISKKKNLTQLKVLISLNIFALNIRFFIFSSYEISGSRFKSEIYLFILFFENKRLLQLFQSFLNK